MTTSRKSQMESWARQWNKAHAPGTRVRYWPGLREGDGLEGTTTSTAQWLGGHTAGVYVAGVGFVAWSHVEAA